ncbi:hypothetical protein [Metabacillus sp. FJAT-52054]|uniref:Large polyvalent protein associated domain-containing protein n=1 Tax=Metabacillus sediminis TaxID=3117746 RepID=A0ABZ2NMQ8_9BACI
MSYFDSFIKKQKEIQSGKAKPHTLGPVRDVPSEIYGKDRGNKKLSEDGGTGYDWTKKYLSPLSSKNFGSDNETKFRTVMEKMGVTDQNRQDEFRQWLDANELMKDTRERETREKETLDNKYKIIGERSLENSVKNRKEAEAEEKLKRDVQGSNGGAIARRQAQDGKDRGGFLGFMDRFVAPISEGAKDFIFPGLTEQEAISEIKSKGELNPVTAAALKDRGLETTVLKGTGAVLSSIAPVGKAYQVGDKVFKGFNAIKNPIAKQLVRGGTAGATFEAGRAAVNEVAAPDQANFGDYAARIGLSAGLGAVGDAAVSGIGTQIAKQKGLKQLFNDIQANQKSVEEIAQSDAFTPKFQAFKEALANLPKKEATASIDSFISKLNQAKALKGETAGIKYPSIEERLKNFTLPAKDIPKVTIPKLSRSEDPGLDDQIKRLFAKDAQAAADKKKTDFNAMFGGVIADANKGMRQTQPKQEFDFDRMYEGFVQYVKEQGYEANKMTPEALDEVFTHYAPKDFPYNLDQLTSKIYKDSPAFKSTMYKQPIGPEQNLRTMLQNDPKIKDLLNGFKPKPKAPAFKEFNKEMDDLFRFFDEPKPATTTQTEAGAAERFTNIDSEPYVPLKRVKEESTASTSPLDPEDLSGQIVKLKETVKNTRNPIEKTALRSQIADLEQEVKMVKEKGLIGEDSTYEDLLVNTDNWKDKTPILYQRETMDRNFEDIMGQDAQGMRKVFLDPVKSKEAERIRFLNDERSKIKEFKIKPGSQDDKFVQMYGENKISLDELKQKTSNWREVDKLAKHYRATYDRMIQEANTVLRENGMKEIPYRKDYFPHYEDLTGFEKFFKEIGFDMNNNSLPTDVNGLTGQFRPNKAFFKHAQQRKTDETAFGASEGFDGYVEGVSNIIHHTKNIKRLRGLENAIRTKYEGDEKLTNFVVELSDYTNSLAGKKNMIDRAAERLVGRKFYNFADTVRRKVAANMIGANVGSALTGYIPMTQALATTSKPSFVKGMTDTFKNVFKDDGFIQQSDFLTKRVGADPLYRNWWNNTIDKSMWLMKTVDMFSAQTIVRSKYAEGLKKGLSSKEAMKQADDWAQRIMAGRAKGDVPTLIGSKSLGALTQFQLEVNNQISFIFKDIPKHVDKKGAASALGQLALYSYFFNNLYEKAVGRRPAFDPLGIAFKAYSDYNDDEKDKMESLGNATMSAINTLPFTSAFAGGRVPVGSVFPNPFAMLKGEAKPEDEFLKPLIYGVLPAGGSQINKMNDAARTLGENPLFPQKMAGVYNDSGQLKYPVDKGTANQFRGLIFGKSAFPETQEYYDKDRRQLSNKQTAALEESANPKADYDAMMMERTINKLKKIKNPTKDQTAKLDAFFKKLEKLKGE